MKHTEVVLIGDVIKSRKQFKPEEWNDFHQLIKKINEEFHSSIKIPITVYSGDSFGGICDSVESAIEIVFAIQERHNYHQSRLVLIEDEVSFGLETKNFLNLEGPALWKSQGLLDNLKKSTSFFLADLQNDLKTIAVNTILNLILSIRNDWSEIEWAVYRHLGLDIKQKDLAEKLGVSQQYVSKISNKSKLKLVREAEKNLIQLLHGIDTTVH
ncbi:SatD family protein [Cyclobacterium roseum]|uniref:SatD family protein n=1 Tax=Cyclobacterium roseum TaxID=2666137 RepID=UPI001390F4F3|nr:SatD family protein [Cyclobacterium roseum]